MLRGVLTALLLLVVPLLPVSGFLPAALAVAEITSAALPPLPLPLLLLLLVLLSSCS